MSKLGKLVTVTVDRPLGTYHPEYKEFAGRVIAIIRRLDDVEGKWVVAPDGMTFTKEEIMEAVRFQEQYFQSEVITG